MSSREGGVKQLSSSLLDMKFMLRTKKKIEEKERKKKENALKNAIQPAEVASSSSDCKDDSKYETTKNLAMLEGLTYGRMSFKGFNKEVEQLMEYYERIRNGEISDDEEEEKDIKDQDMAQTLGNAALSKKFASRRERQMDSNKMDEKSGKRLNFSDYRKRGANVDTDAPERKFLKPSD